MHSLWAEMGVFVFFSSSFLQSGDEERASCPGGTGHQHGHSEQLLQVSTESLNKVVLNFITVFIKHFASASTDKFKLHQQI